MICNLRKLSSAHAHDSRKMSQSHDLKWSLKILQVNIFVFFSSFYSIERLIRTTSQKVISSSILQTRREIFSSSRNNSWGPNYQSSCCVESAQTGVSSRLLLRRLPILPTHVRAICVCQLSFARSRHHQYIYRVFG